MKRRGVAWLGTAFVVAVTIALATLIAPATSTSVHAFDTPRVAPDVTAPDETVPDAPSVTSNDFFPDEENLSDCLGLLEKPGCGSEGRGGWGQTLVFGILVVGLGLIIWRIASGVRANRPDPPPTSPT